MSQTSCCVPGCKVVRGQGIALHTFPNPNDPNKLEKFRTWVMKIGGDIVGLDNLSIYKNRRVCHRHFEAVFTFPNQKLTALAIPTLHIPGVHISQLKKPLSMIVNQPSTSSRATSQLVNPPISPKPGTSRDTYEPLEKGVHICKPLPMNQPSASLEPAPQAIEPPVSPKPGTSTGHMEQVPLEMKKSISKTERELRNVITEIKVKLRKCQKSKDILKTKLMLSNKLTLTDAFKRLCSRMTPAAQTFFEMQIGQFGKRPRGRRFSLEEKILALSIYKPSPKAYRLFSEICILPKKRTLDKLLQKVQLLPGINDIIFEHLKKRVEELPERHRYCNIIFDEMAIAAGVTFDKTNDLIHGLNDDGTERKSVFCDHVLVFMVRGIHKKFKQPVAFTFCSGTTKTDTLTRLIKTVIKKVMSTGLNVVATVSDQGATNMAAINNLLNETKAEYLRKEKNYSGRYFEVDGNKIYHIFDPPHLMKGIRNNLITKDLEFEENKKLKKAKWSHLDAMYRKGPAYNGVSLVPKLTAEHVIPNKIRKMKVKLCTQVFSQSVGVAMGYMAALGQLPKECQDTADLFMFFDKLFDSVNGNFSQPEAGKFLRSAVTPTSEHQDFWRKSLFILKTMNFVTNNDKKTTVPSITSWIKTIESFQDLTKFLHTQGLDSLLLRNFNQDPLENFFGSIRSHGLRNTMPNAYSFINYYKSLLINNLTSIHSVGSNCEKDDGYCLDSLKKFLIDDGNMTENKNNENIEINENHLNLSLIDTKKLIESDDPRDQEKCAAIAYCSGWLVKSAKKNIYKKCSGCKECLESEEVQKFHSFIKFKEYSNKSWLIYPTFDIFDYFCQVENIVAEILNSSWNINNISNYIEIIVNVNVNLNFITCTSHKQQITKFILKKSIYFFINKWCKNINNILSGKTICFEKTDVTENAAHNYFLKHKTRAH